MDSSPFRRRRTNNPAGLLVAAAGAGHAGRVRELLAAGVLPDSESQGTFAIHRAAVAGSVAALQILVEAGAHLEALDQYGQTALTQAAVLWQCGSGGVPAQRGRQPERPCRTEPPDAPEGDPERLDGDSLASVATSSEGRPTLRGGLGTHSGGGRSTLRSRRPPTASRDGGSPWRRNRAAVRRESGRSGTAPALTNAGVRKCARHLRHSGGRVSPGNRSTVDGSP